ncbi:MAG: LLM class flavin-dependent oxidoreductase, partial [Rhodospirillaceae bacterium]|nr:LLM class flavin-dependent oxidoreductase [Rhodospirillaceae bacterium]
YFGYKAGRQTMHGFWNEMDKLGKDRNPYRAAFLQFVGVAETEEEAYKLYREPAEYFYGRCLHVDPRYLAAPGYVTEATQRAGLQSQIARAADDNRSSLAVDKSAREFDAILDNGYVIIGTPDQVAERLREVAKDLHVGHLMLLLQFGNMGKDLVNYNSKLYAEQVIPQLADLWEDWEDHWWPNPMPMADRASPGPVGPGMAAE